MKFFVVLILSVLIYESIAESYIKMPEKGRQNLIQQIRNLELTFSDSNYSPYFKKLIQGLASCMTTNECRNLIKDFANNIEKMETELNDATTKYPVIKKPFKWG